MVRRTIALLALIIGIIAIVLGIAIGNVTHQVSYQHIENAHILHYLFRPNEQYDSASIQTASNPALYTLPLNNFTPHLDGNKLLKAGYGYASFSYDVGQTIHIDVRAKTGTHLVGDAYRIVSITFRNAAGDQQAFTSSEYTQHPQGYNYNTWRDGFITIGVGILLVIIGAFLFRKQIQTLLFKSIYDVTGDPPQKA